MKKTIIKTEGMTCGGCEAKIENKLKKQDGIVSVKADSGKNIVNVSYEENKIDINTILETIEKLHYSACIMKDNARHKNPPVQDKMSIIKIFGIGAVILAIYLIIKNTIGFNFIPEINQNMGYGMLFVVGLLTSLHCMAMCGGINISQCMKNDITQPMDKIMPSLLYNIGRVISYTVIGGIVGAIGSVLSIRRKSDTE